MEFVSKGSFNSISAVVQVMALAEPMMTQFIGTFVFHQV